MKSLFLPDGGLQQVSSPHPPREVCLGKLSLRVEQWFWPDDKNPAVFTWKDVGVPGNKSEGGEMSLGLSLMS